MPYTLEQGNAILRNTIKNKLTHRDYPRVCALALEYTAYVTGEDNEFLHKQFSPREDTAQFKQKLELSSAVTSAMANGIMNPMYKIGRSRADSKITWKKTDKSEDNKSELLDVANKFYGDESVESYLTNRMVEIDSTDPNSFIVTEASGSFDPSKPLSATNKKLEAYPFEVNSHEAVNYKFVNNELQFLIVKNDYNGPVKDGKQLVFSNYTIYLENESVVARQIHKDDLQSFVTENPSLVYDVFYTDEARDKADVFIITISEHKAGRIPARRVGTKKDLKTRGRTCVPLMHPAHPYFKKSIKVVSEFDLSTCLHLFPQKIQYSDLCPGDMENQQTCREGKTAEGGTCSLCKGTGYKIHTTGSDVILVKMPKDTKDMVSLENYITYKGPDLELIKFQMELGLFKLPELALKAVYNSELFSTDSVATTATEKNIDLDSVYDTLKPFADNWSAMWKHIMNVIASYRDLSEGITIQHQYPKDFKMKSLTMLLEDLSKASTSGAPSYIKNEINKDITQKLYIDSPSELLKIDIKNKFFPFNGKTESEISNIITNDLCTKYNKILYANFDNIFDELEVEQSMNNVDFYKVEKTKQATMIKEKVTAIISELDTELSSDRSNVFGSAELPGGGATP